MAGLSGYQKLFCSCLDCNLDVTSVGQVLSYEAVASVELRRKRAKAIYDKCIYADMLAMSSAVSGGWRVVEKWREEGGGVGGVGRMEDGG